MTASRQLARYVRSLRPRELGDEAREGALRCVLDLLAAAAAGHTDRSVGAARRMAISEHGSGTASIWFTGQVASLLGAAFANSAAASILDLDDGFRLARGHPGAAVIPSAFAAASEGTTAEDFLAAVVAGYEVGVRVAQGRPDYAPTGVWSPYAAIAAAASLRGTDEPALAHALAIAAQAAPAMPGKAGLVGSDVKEGIPFGTLAGLQALRLAECGFTGPPGILDLAGHFDGARITAGLGGPPCIGRTYFKPYACCRHIHAPVDAYVALAARAGFAAKDIDAIEVHTYGGTFNLSNRTSPATLVEAQYSVPFCLALAALRGTRALLPLEPAWLEDEDVRALASRVTLHRDAAIEARFPAESPARVVVSTAAGRFESPVTTPRGDPDAPLDWDDLVAKFSAATRRALPGARQAAILAAVDRLRAGELAPLREALGTG